MLWCVKLGFRGEPWFSTVNTNTINLSFKKSNLESVFKTSVFVAENAFYVWTGGANGEKNLRFRKPYGYVCTIIMRFPILGDPGAGKSLNGREKFRAKTFSLPDFFSRLFRLFPAPTNCPWVSEDGDFPNRVFVKHDESKITSDSCVFKIPPA